MGIAPVISDGDLTLGESAAIVDYIPQTHGGGRLIPQRGDAGFADYLYWFHFANATLQATLGRAMALERLDGSVGLSEHSRVSAADRRARWVSARDGEGGTGLRTAPGCLALRSPSAVGGRVFDVHRPIAGPWEALP